MENSDPNSEAIVTPTDIEGGDDKITDQQIQTLDENPKDIDGVEEKQDESSGEQTEITTHERQEIEVVNDDNKEGPSEDAEQALESQHQVVNLSNLETNAVVHQSETNYAYSVVSSSSKITKITYQSSSIQHVQTSSQQSNQLEVTSSGSGIVQTIQSEHLESQQTSDIQGQSGELTQEQQQLLGITQGVQLITGSAENESNVENIEVIEGQQGKEENQEVSYQSAGKDEEDIVQGERQDNQDKQEVVDGNREEQSQEVKGTQEQEELIDEQGFQGGQSSDVVVVEKLDQKEGEGEEESSSQREDQKEQVIEVKTSNEDQVGVVQESSSSHVAQVVEVVETSSAQRMGSQVLLQGGQVIEGQVDIIQGQEQQQQEQQQQSVQISSSSNIKSEIRQTSSQILKTSQIITTTITTTTTTRRVMTADGGSYIEQSSENQTQQQQSVENGGSTSGQQVEEVHETITQVVNSQVQDEGQRQQKLTQEEEQAVQEDSKEVRESKQTEEVIENQQNVVEEQTTKIIQGEEEISGQESLKKEEITISQEEVQQQKQQQEQVKEEGISEEVRKDVTDENDDKQQEQQETQENAGYQEDNWEENIEGEERAFEEGSKQHQKEQAHEEEKQYDYDDYQQYDTNQQHEYQQQQQQDHEDEELKEEEEQQYTQKDQEESIYQEQLTKRRVLIEQVKNIQGFPQELLTQLQEEEKHFEEELISLKSQRQQLRVIAVSIQQREVDLAAIDADYQQKKEKLEEEKRQLEDINQIKAFVEKKEGDLREKEMEIQASLEFLKEKDNLIAKKEEELQKLVESQNIVSESQGCEGQEEEEEYEEKTKTSKPEQSKCQQCQCVQIEQIQSENQQQQQQLLEQISTLQVELQAKSEMISQLQMQLANQQNTERDLSGYEELLKESRVMSETLRQTRLESDSKQNRIQELEERLHYSTTQLSTMQEQLSQTASEKQKLISTIETQTLQCTQLQSKLRIQASDDQLKSSNLSSETNNYQDIIADLRDTIVILSSENDEYKQKLENVEKANRQLIGSFQEIKSSLGGQKSIEGEIEVLQAKYDAAVRALEDKSSESKTYEQRITILERQLQKLHEERLIEQKLVEDERNELLQVKDWENQQINSDYNNKVKILEEQLLEKDNHTNDQVSAYTHEITQLKMQLRVIMEEHVLMQKKYEARNGLDQEEQEKALNIVKQQLLESNEQLQISKQLLQQQQTQSAQQQLQDAQIISNQQEELHNQSILVNELQRRLKEMNDKYEDERSVTYERNVKIEFQEEEWKRRDIIIETQNLKISELIRANESYQIEITLLLGRLTASENKTEKLISELDQVNQKYTVQILGLQRETQSSIAALQVELNQSKSDYAKAEAGRVQAALAAETAEKKLIQATTKIGQLEIAINELKETSISSEKRLKDQLFEAEKNHIQINEANKVDRDNLYNEYNTLVIISKEYELKILSYERDNASRIQTLQSITSQLNQAEDLIASLTKQNAQLNEQIQILSRDLEETRKQCLLFQNDAETHQIRADSKIKENQNELRIENQELKEEVIKLTEKINQLSDGYQNFYDTTRQSSEKMEADKESISLALISKDKEVKQQQQELDQCRGHIAQLSEQLNSKDTQFNEQLQSLYSDIRQLVLERDTARSAEQTARLVAIDGQSSKSTQLQEQVKALLQELDRQEDALKEANRIQISLKQELASSQKLIEKQQADIIQLENIMSNQSNHIKTLDARLQGQDDTNRLNEENILLRREIDQKLRESDIKVQTIMNEKKSLEFKLLDQETEHTSALRENSLKIQQQYEQLIANQLAKIEDLTQQNQRLAYLKSSQISGNGSSNNGQVNNLNGLQSSGSHNSYTNGNNISGNLERNTPKKTIELLPPRSLRPGRESPYGNNNTSANSSEQLQNGSFRANSPSNQVSVTSALALAAGHASNTGLDQAYIKCLQRSKNLLNRNESILSTLKAANSLDRSETVINTSWNNNNNQTEKITSSQQQQQVTVNTNISSSGLLNNSIASSSSRVALSTPKAPLYIKKIDSERPPFLQATETLQTRTSAVGVSEHLRSSPAVQNNSSLKQQASTDFVVSSSTTTTTNMPQYQGERLGNLRHGRGRCFYPNGEVYEGEWKSDKRHGYGILRDSNGEIYNGDWEFDLYHGQGRLRNKLSEPLSKEFDYTNFELLRNQWVSYSGEFKNHSLHGLGTLILSNGEKFLGSFSGGKVHGEGTFYRQTGDIEVGYWQNNKFIGKL